MDPDKLLAAARDLVHLGIKGNRVTDEAAICQHQLRVISVPVEIRNADTWSAVQGTGAARPTNGTWFTVRWITGRHVPQK